MKQILLLFSAAGLILLTACSDPENAPTSPPGEAQVSVHVPGWNDPASPNFHGKFLAAKQYDASECRQCHGNQYDGGLVGVSCKTCHASFPHPENFVSGHQTFLKANTYDLNSCKPCHGEDYATVKIDNSCLTCHTQQGGPEACNLCHGNGQGDAADLFNAAPPTGLDGESDSTAAVVGAHRAHLPFNPAVSTAEACRECHTVPADFEAARHINADYQAEILFNGALGALRTEGGARVPNASYDAAANSCSGTYCHGNWGLLKSRSMFGTEFFYVTDKMEGNTFAPKWVDPNTAACETCHGLPPAGHYPHELHACTICHGDVVDEFGRLKNRTKHANGKVNVFEMEYPMF